MKILFSRLLAPTRGFEPPTYRLGGDRYYPAELRGLIRNIQFSYTPKRRNNLPLRRRTLYPAELQAHVMQLSKSNGGGCPWSAELKGCFCAILPFYPAVCQCLICTARYAAGDGKRCLYSARRSAIMIAGYSRPRCAGGFRKQ